MGSLGGSWGVLGALVGARSVQRPLWIPRAPPRPHKSGWDDILPNRSPIYQAQNQSANIAGSFGKKQIRGDVGWHGGMCGAVSTYMSVGMVACPWCVHRHVCFGFLVYFKYFSKHWPFLKLKCCRHCCRRRHCSLHCQQKMHTGVYIHAYAHTHN